MIVVAFAGLILIGSSTNNQPTDVVEETSTSTPEEAGTSTDMERMTLSGTSTYEASQTESEVEWTGSKQIVRDWIDTGTLAIASSSATVEGGELTAGQVTFDMTDLRVVSESNPDAEPSRLETHLKSGDFFSVEEYPEASFVLTEVTSSTSSEFTYELTGDLTIKGTTNEISFPAEVYQTADGHLIVEGSAVVDRTRFGIRYGSDSFFDNLGDNVISDEFEVDMSVVFEPVTQE